MSRKNKSRKRLKRENEEIDAEIFVSNRELI